MTWQEWNNSRTCCVKAYVAAGIGDAINIAWLVHSISCTPRINLVRPLPVIIIRLLYVLPLAYFLLLHFIDNWCNTLFTLETYAGYTQLNKYLLSNNMLVLRFFSSFRAIKTKWILTCVVTWHFMYGSTFL